MAVNITFDGFCSRDDGSLSNLDVQYQGYFKKEISGSSDSKWNSVRTVSNLGYWNINLGSGDWLGPAGNATAGDKVVIVFWRTGSDRNADCLTLDEWGAFEITLDGSATYTNPTQVKTNIAPNLSWTFPDTGYVNIPYVSTNDSNDINSWDWSGTTMYHWYTRYGQTINNVNQVDNSDYYWGDTSSDLDLPGAATGTHQWSSAGIYNIDLVVEDECGATVTGTDQIQIYWHAPTCAVTMIPAIPDPNEPVSFQWTGSDVDNRITSIDWVINDSGIYGNTNTTTSGAKGDVIPHSAGTGTDWCGEAAAAGAFTNPGSHVINVVVNYNDGFSNQTVRCNPTFTQNRFTGPTANFTQDPAQAVVGSGVEFTNTSSDPDNRVGLGLDDCDEYDWRWTDDGMDTDYLDKPYSYKLLVTPGSANCEVRLCANYSDGWETKQTCETKGVVFGTEVTITEVDCYYNLNVIGTSGDGTVSGYSWTIASGINETGPWTDIWTTPTGIEQNNKKICFTSMGWYKATGYVYGSGATTNDDEVLYITEVCPTTTSGVTAIEVLWNGTGILDIGGDWTHNGYGTETAASKHAGTNGLDATNMSKNDKIYFEASEWTDISDYDMLTFWINIKEWQSNKDIEISLHGHTGGNWHTVNLSNYTDIYSGYDSWRKVFISLEDFNITSGLADRLRLTSTGNIGVWLDDIEFSMGTVVGVPICEPDMYGSEWGKLDMTGHELRPSVKAQVDIVPSARIINTYPLPRNL